MCATRDVTDTHVDVEVFPAAVGDAILIRCHSHDTAINILVDGGVRATYGTHLATRLKQLQSNGERLDLLVVTHIDTDHIGGALELLKNNGDARSPSVIDICDVWHNGYRHLGLTGRAPTETERNRVLRQSSRPESEISGDGTISVREADSLARLLATHGYKWNRSFNGGPVLAGNVVSLADDIRITLLSPLRADLERLAYVWQRDLLEMGVPYEAVDCPEFAAAFEADMLRTDSDSHIEDTDISAHVIDSPPDPSTFVEDTSPTNGSSIAFLLTCFGLRMLFLGDSWPSVVSEQWDLLHSGGPCEDIDVIKVSHHGSRHNTSPYLLTRVTARHFIVSTDGSKHNHPSVEAMLWIVDANRKGTSVVFNYPTNTATHMNRPELRRKFGHDVVVGTGVDPVVLTLRQRG